jgi:imidazole glycerol-phosphate synthase subunit HisH
VADVVIIDSGGANLASLEIALGRLGASSLVTSDPQRVAAAARVILPGVGSAADAMTRLRHCGLDRAIRAARQPVLGICLGMQLLYSHSEEGATECLGILPESVRRLTASPGLPVPHMGWNQLLPLREDPLLSGLQPHDYVYFVHSYAAPLSAATVSACDYGTRITAIVRRDNFWGVQFHPERSSRCGARVLRNFLEVR